MAATREYDIVLFGATGFTGGLTAEYLAAHAPAGLRWAIAGRNRSKLEAVRSRLGVDVALLIADSTDAESLKAVAEASRVVITTVGPYVQHGGPLVAACAEAGTDYVDLTGEPEFVDQTYLAQHQTAVRTGARLVHCCGFDSIPHDLGAYFTVLQLPENVPLTVRGYVRAAGTFSGGTFHSAVLGFSRARANLSAAKARKQYEPRSSDRSSKAVSGTLKRDGEQQAWVVPLPTIDPQVIARSGRALPRYGPDFRYSHFAAVKRLPVAVGGVLGVAGLFTAAQIPPLRTALLNRVKQGEGPSAERRATSWFSVQFVGEGGGRRVVTEVRGGDPGYGETAKMLSESALCLALDELPATSGQVTTATAMGDALLARLQKAGITFEVLESS